jgi:hypothetical protein
MLAGSLAWSAVAVPIFVMDVFDLNTNIVLGVVLLLAQFPVLHFGIPAFLLKAPSRALTEIVVDASGQKLLSQDVVRALKKAPWGHSGKGVASSTRPTIRSGIRLWSVGREWQITLSPDLSTGTVSLVESLDRSTEPKDTDLSSSRQVHDAVILLPKDILERRKTSGIQLLISMGAIILSGFILSLAQSHVSRGQGAQETADV